MGVCVCVAFFWRELRIVCDLFLMFDEIERKFLVVITESECVNVFQFVYLWFFSVYHQNMFAIECVCVFFFLNFCFDLFDRLFVISTFLRKYRLHRNLQKENEIKIERIQWFLTFSTIFFLRKSFKKTLSMLTDSTEDFKRIICLVVVVFFFYFGI